MCFYVISELESFGVCDVILLNFLVYAGIRFLLTASNFDFFCLHQTVQHDDGGFVKL